MYDLIEVKLPCMTCFHGPIAISIVIKSSTRNKYQPHNTAVHEIEDVSEDHQEEQIEVISQSDNLEAKLVHIFFRDASHLYAEGRMKSVRVS